MPKSGRYERAEKGTLPLKEGNVGFGKIRINGAHQQITLRIPFEIYEMLALHSADLNISQALYVAQSIVEALVRDGKCDASVMERLHGITKDTDRISARSRTTRRLEKRVARLKEQKNKLTEKANIRKWVEAADAYRQEEKKKIDNRLTRFLGDYDKSVGIEPTDGYNKLGHSEVVQQEGPAAPADTEQTTPEAPSDLSPTPRLIDFA